MRTKFLGIAKMEQQFSQFEEGMPPYSHQTIDAVWAAYQNSSGIAKEYGEETSTGAEARTLMGLIVLLWQKKLTVSMPSASPESWLFSSLKRERDRA